MAMKTKSTLEEACHSKKCPASAQPDIDRLDTYATVSTVGFVVGAVGVGTWATMALWPRATPAADATQSRAVTQDGRGVRAHPWIGPGVVGLRGAF
jgi:hypothetical protein